MSPGADGDLLKLSVGELKKQLFWCGSAVPAGHLEKADLVEAVRRAREEKADRDRKKAVAEEAQKKAQEQKEEEQRWQERKKAASRPAPRPLDYEQKQDKSSQDV
eukprot:CAMPEP_0176138026 /NCGR_PEP_ID=MMETSP0120_2-20121206/70103_1 /TAXON_ID=160619 /ORGANISM="Kryptoperidinium foliaceum, Strain CCMP 1326" /LENGTH=104 /DNA_ID=CAMNT_0017473939 /DNA_START=21 /DNA_END=332 /DNA_ORIENTATION=-